jgi:response regulator RpfG family c-di-GMP phosphodiesterase
MENEKETLRVLLIDDSQDDVVLVAMELSKHYKLVWNRVENMAGLILALEDLWDVVLCDYKLPGFSAEQALLLVRNSKHDGIIPFIVISGVVNEDTAMELIKKGANDFISKDTPRRLALAVQREVVNAREKVGDELRTKVRIEEAFNMTIAAWGEALELRDIHTAGHTRRVTDCSLKLAIAMGLHHSNFTDLHRGALLHDVGKMGIPDMVLLKQDVLSKEEFEIMKMHPVYAKRMLKGIPFLQNAIEIPYAHHERWDGSGYPEGLKGKEIPLLARMFAIVDVYDALTSDRPYRTSWEKSRVIAYLLDERGHLFDPEIIDVFVNMVGRQ